jgi:protein ImuB
MRREKPGAVPKRDPFALVEASAHGLIITAVNDAARAAGVQEGSRLADVRAALPHLLSAHAEPAHDRRALRALARWCGRYGPARNIALQPAGSTVGAAVDHGIWIDVTGVSHLFAPPRQQAPALASLAAPHPDGETEFGDDIPDAGGGEAQLLADLIRRLASFGITARAALADTLGAAHALARYGTSADRPFHIALAGQSRAALAQLPIEGLRLDADTLLLLRRLGLKRIGQLYGLPRSALERRFRSAPAAMRRSATHAKAMAGAVLMRLDQALGVRPEPLAPLMEPPRFLVRCAFLEPLLSSEGIETTVAELAAELAGVLGETHRGARRLHLRLYRADGSCVEIRIGLGAPSRNARHLFRLLQEKLSGIDAGFGIDAITLAATRVEWLGEQQTALAPMKGGATQADQNLLIDRLVNRLGTANVFRLAARQSHIPERAQVCVPALRDAPTMLPPPRTPPLPPRPPFLLATPEPITVVAEVPEGPPAHMTWRRLKHRIVRAAGPERIAGEWWRLPQSSPANDPPLAPTRDYYRVEDETGAVYWVFREGLYGAEETSPPRWFLHGVFA